LKELVGCPLDAQAKGGQAIQDRWPGQGSDEAQASDEPGS
jgi:hypothetical protein